MLLSHLRSLLTVSVLFTSAAGFISIQFTTLYYATTRLAHNRFVSAHPIGGCLIYQPIKRSVLFPSCSYDVFFFHSFARTSGLMSHFSITVHFR